MQVIPSEIQSLVDRKFNAWGHRKPLVSTDDERYRRAAEYGARSDLTPTERSALYLHELTGCQGLEFVAFSDAELESPLTLPFGVVLFPCFIGNVDRPSNFDQYAQATLRMAREPFCV